MIMAGLVWTTPHGKWLGLEQERALRTVRKLVDLGRSYGKSDATIRCDLLAGVAEESRRPSRDATYHETWIACLQRAINELLPEGGS